MRQPYAQTAILSMSPEGDTNAPGAAITIEVCGHWDHKPPCPLAPHFISYERIGPELHIRVLFVADPEDEPQVRDRIKQALSTGSHQGTSWELLSCTPSDVLPTETAHAERLAKS